MRGVSSVGNSSAQRWLPGMSTRAAVSAVKSHSGHIAFTTISSCGRVERIDRVVGVQRLRGLAGTDLDAGRRAQLVVAEHAVEHTEDERIGGRRVERARLAEQAVDAARLEAFELAAPERRRLEDARQVGARRLDRVGGHDVLDERPPVALATASTSVRRCRAGRTAVIGARLRIGVYASVYTWPRWPGKTRVCSIAPPAGPPSCAAASAAFAERGSPTPRWTTLPPRPGSPG